MTKKYRTLITSKYISMLFSGTVLMVLTAIMSMADILIAVSVLGEDAAAGINLVLPVYFLSSFFAFSYNRNVLVIR